MSHTGKLARVLRAVNTFSVIGAIAIWGLPMLSPMAAVVSNGRVGQNTSPVMEYAITNARYTRNADNQENIDEVTFDLDPAPAVGATVKMRLSSSEDTWYSCSHSAASATCATTSPQASVVEGGELRVTILR